MLKGFYSLAGLWWRMFWGPVSEAMKKSKVGRFPWEQQDRGRGQEESDGDQPVKVDSECLWTHWYLRPTLRFSFLEYIYHKTLVTLVSYKGLFQLCLWNQKRGRVPVLGRGRVEWVAGVRCNWSQGHWWGSPEQLSAVGSGITWVHLQNI